MAIDGAGHGEAAEKLDGACGTRRCARRGPRFPDAHPLRLRRPRVLGLGPFSQLLNVPRRVQRQWLSLRRSSALRLQQCDGSDGDIEGLSQLLLRKPTSSSSASGSSGAAGSSSAAPSSWVMSMGT
eukprot:CAMPEP_0170162776 /NCGR_PEP_ID=MMETSP0033_2-20121228/77267_1 /TAXON_ID=195969 /ORGANISM="Dolichomastix tenuilepis, Strain CCMP3274" /LENGTH=125 /DNA_ID=CAMNT_0010400405 /DNA_START=956 /DNA_END=1334 /DNA_ORIENTATION=+